MKSRFLDKRNYHALLPHWPRLPLIQRLDECLRQINDTPGEKQGSIDALIRHNERTITYSHGSKRLCISPIQIAQRSIVANRDIHTIARTGPSISPASLHINMVFENKITWKTIVPLQFLLKGWGDANSGHQCYIHIISHNMNHIHSFDELKARWKADSDEYYYVGITSRNWLLRLNEHIGEMHRGIRKKFHTAWRESLGLTGVYFISMLRDINMTYEDAMNWEERNVDKISYGPNGLNMIPGGFKGLQYLHTHRIINQIDISLEERDTAIADFVRRNPRKGIPNPFIAELWKDDEFYLKVIEAREKTLSPEQVRNIRKLARMGKSVTEITKEVCALNELQVKNVISGKTYDRIQ